MALSAVSETLPDAYGLGEMTFLAEMPACGYSVVPRSFQGLTGTLYLFACIHPSMGENEKL